MKIGLISDTHGYLDEQVFKYFQECDEIWHAGDIGTLELIKKLEGFKPVKAVWGNIDGKEIRAHYPENQVFECEGKKIWMTHIGGKPPLYARGIKARLKEIQPHIFICGHSHILRVITDDKIGNLLYVNPGAAGLQGFHKIRTLLRFEITAGKIANMQVVELGKRGQIN